MYIEWCGLQVNKSSTDFWNNLKLIWQQCANLPMKCYATSVAELDGKVYIAVTGNKGCYFDPLVYDSSKDCWSELPKLPHGGFSLVAVLHKKQLLAIGGMDDRHNISNKVFAWDEQNRKWSTPYPNMPTARYYSSSISHGSTVIVAGGVTCSHPQTMMTGVVEVLHIKERDSRFSKSSCWSVVERLPHVTRETVPLIIDDNLLIAAGCNDNDEGTCSIVTASLSELLQSGNKKTMDGKAWHKLPDMPYSSWSINHYQGRLIVFNGDRKVEQSKLTCKSTWKVFQQIHLYNLDKMSWDCVGDDFHDYKLGKSVHIGKNKIFFIGGMTGGNFTVCRGDDIIKTCSLLTLTSK